METLSPRSVLPALPRGPPGLPSSSLPSSTLGIGSCSAPWEASSALGWGLAQLSGSPEYPRCFKQESQTANWPRSGNWAASPERGSRQPEVTKQIRTKFKVLSTASGKRQDRPDGKRGVEEGHPDHCCGSGLKTRSIFHCELLRTLAGT